MIPQEKWKWLGLPGHFCAASDCSFRLCTIIGKYKISTVGAYYPRFKENKEMERIGNNRHYETYVFLKDSLSQLDGDGLSLNDVENRDPYKADELAEKMHLKMCKKWAKKK